MAASAVKNPQSQPIGTGRTNPPNHTKVEVQIKPLTISIFFDGTGNNRFNTAANRKKDPFQRDYDQKRKSVSYNNYYSNVAILYLSQDPQIGLHEQIYIEGAGTFKYREDTDYGLGFARGDSGIEARVGEAISKVVKLASKTRKVRLNVYGFSRGAAYARYFCWKIKQQEKALNIRCYINFVGLFDTVSSADVAHYNDVEEFHLDIGAPEGIRRIVHLTAENDYRAHFPLTPIKTAATKEDIGFECRFPGAHSDIGGGYYEPWYDEELMLSHKNMALVSTNHIYYKWYMQKGYFTENQLKTKGYYPQEYMVGSREIKIDYQFITGGIMMEMMKQQAGFVERDGSPIGKQIKAMRSIPVLDKFYIQAENYVLSNYMKSGLHFKVPLLTATEMKQIYNRFVHISLDAKGGAVINPANTGTPKSKSKTPSGNLNPLAPLRPKVTKGYRS